MKSGNLILGLSSMKTPTKYLLEERDVPQHWYNLAADLPEPMPAVLNPSTGKPIGPDDLAALFPPALIQQEVSVEREMEIPEEVRDILKLWRPSPLFRAHRLEAALQTPAKIFYKYEGVSPAGSHKPNTAVAQAYYNREAGIKKLTTETGAGQWGSSLAMASSMMGIDCTVFMVRVSFDQKPYRRALMETFGAHVHASPSPLTQTGQSILQRDPDCNGSLGIAIAEAVELAAGRDDTNYALGSVLNHVLLHQTVIGLECLKQLEMADAFPDVIVGCTGGGSNFAGIAFPFLGKKLRGESDIRFLAVEPEACPTMTRGQYAYDYGDTAGLTPLVKMHTLGSSFIPPGIHAGGLRYHGMAPMISKVLDLGYIEAKGLPQLECFSAGIQFAKAEGILPAPEANHAVAGAIREAVRCREENAHETILFNLCGHGHFDMQAYIHFLCGQLKDYAYPQEEIAMALSGLPVVRE